MNAIITFLGTAFNFLTKNETVIAISKFIAWRTILMFLIGTGIYIIISNVYNYVSYSVIDLFSTEYSNTVDGTPVLYVDSLLGFLIIKFKILDCLNMVISAINVRFLLNLIPFHRL
jgi:hypothetical protein